MHTLYWGLRKIPFTLYDYVLVKILQNGAKFIQKLTTGFKNHMRNLSNFRQAVEIPKSWNLMGFGVKKYIPSAKTYTEDLSNVIFNYLCENPLSYLWNFLKHKWFFTKQLLCIFLAQTLHTFCKSSLSKWKFSDFPLLKLKFTKFLMSLFKKSQFLFKVSIFFKCHER